MDFTGHQFVDLVIDKQSNDIKKKHYHSVKLPGD